MNPLIGDVNPPIGNMNPLILDANSGSFIELVAYPMEPTSSVLARIPAHSLSSVRIAHLIPSANPNGMNSGVALLMGPHGRIQASLTCQGYTDSVLFF